MLSAFERRTIQEIARDKLEGQGITRLFLKQLVMESALLVKRNVSFRKRENEHAVEAYCRMAIHEFQGINARQRWANWRTIPRNLHLRLPSGPVRAIDLCCGIGDSTEVLACYLPRGSTLLGLEYNSRFVEAARARRYLHRSGAPVNARFRTQSVLQPFHDEDGERIARGSIGLVNSCGAVGSHFDSHATEILAREIARVLRRGGLATIDCGAPGTGRRELVRIFLGHGFEALHSARSHPLDLFAQVCFRKL